MQSDQVAVIVPVYNRATVVLETLESVAVQTQPPHRLIVVDDGSTDDTATSVERWMRTRQPQFSTRLLRAKHRGAPAARNRGFEHALDCPLVAFLDSDDLWPGDFVARCTAALNAKRSAVAASCDRLRVDTGTDKSTYDSLQSIADGATHWLFTNDAGIGSATMFRTAAIQELGGYNEATPTGHDMELFLPLSVVGPWLHVPGSPTVFRRGLPQRRGEAQHLSDTYYDCHRRWAQILDNFIAEQRGARAMSRRVYSAVLAQRWYWAGRFLMQGGRPAEARGCLRRSLRWQFWKLRTWSRLARTLYPRAA